MSRAHSGSSRHSAAFGFLLKAGLGRTLVGSPRVGKFSLIVCLLAVIAGLLGMHVLAGTHSMSAAAVFAVSLDTNAAEQHVHHAQHSDASQPALAAATAVRPSTTATQSCVDHSGACSAMAGMHTVCVPAPGKAPLTAPLPATTAVASHQSHTAGHAPAYDYLPGSPSPGQLCISRT